jgi:hypothetical protein
MAFQISRFELGPSVENRESLVTHFRFSDQSRFAIPDRALSDFCAWIYQQHGETYFHEQWRSSETSPKVIFAMDLDGKGVDKSTWKPSTWVILFNTSKDSSRPRLRP